MKSRTSIKYQHESSSPHSPAPTELITPPSSSPPKFEFAAAGANLVAALAGDGSSADITALFPVKGTGVPTQIAYGDFCITANGVVPSTADQTLYIADCDPADATQLWTVNESPATVSNADGNCLTLGRAARGVPVSLAECNDVLLHLQIWDPKPVSA